MSKTYYLTTAIAYTSGKPHIGNTYEAILADSIVRFKRQQGYDVRFQTGTDEHGQKIELKAAEAGITPKEFVDNVSGVIKEIWDLMNTSYDKFIRTTDPDHEKQVQKIFKKLYDQGDIYKGYYEGMYCTPCESFFTESQLVDGKCPDCGREVTPAKEEAYFFRMSKYADRLIEHINTHPEFIQPESRKNEMMNNFLLPGLQDLCVSRTSFKWGIPVDFDPKHVVYVWIDALSNYITGLGYDVDGNNDPLYDKYWPADLHLIGKDILRFHTIYWPIMLMALDVPLPKQIFGHPWLLQGDGKMSKSKGEFLTVSLLEEKGYNPMAYRFFCLQSHYRKPLEFSWDALDNVVSAYDKLVKRIANLSTDGEVDTAACEEWKMKFAEALSHDINTSSAITVLYDMLKAELSDASKRVLVQSMDEVLSLQLEKAWEEKEADVDDELASYVEKKIEERKEAKKAKDFAKADAIREELLAKGIVLKDTREGTFWEKQ